MAEREGFEPSVGLRLHMISNHAHSTTLSPLRVGGRGRVRREGSAQFEGNGRSTEKAAGLAFATDEFPKSGLRGILPAVRSYGSAE